MKKVIERIAAYAVTVADPEKIILFGSMANETNDVYSDLDLLIVTDRSSDKRQIIEQISQFAQELAMTADVIVCSKRDLENVSEERFSLLGGILKSGKIIYKKAE
jgi:predicted nucleotidyltransferase